MEPGDIVPTEILVLLNLPMLLNPSYIFRNYEYSPQTVLMVPRPLQVAEHNH